jgi:hypothetical protein
MLVSCITPNKMTKNIEYQTTGKFGHGSIVITPTGVRQVEIIWKEKPPLFTKSTQVNLQAISCPNLPKAIDKACHSLGFLPTFVSETVKGPKAIVTAFYADSAKTKGYATINKKGSKSLRFSLERIDLSKMGCSNQKEALRKIAFVTGTISLKQKESNAI